MRDWCIKLFIKVIVRFVRFEEIGFLFLEEYLLFLLIIIVFMFKYFIYFGYIYIYFNIMFVRLSGYLVILLNLYIGFECIFFEIWMLCVFFISKMWLFWIFRMVKEKVIFLFCGGLMVKNKRWSGIFKNLF